MPERLSHLLDGMPVVAIDGRTGDGGKALADAIAASFEGTPVPHGLTALPTATADADVKAAGGRRLGRIAGRRTTQLDRRHIARPRHTCGDHAVRPHRPRCCCTP